MEERLFGNSHVISWLQYFADNTDIDLEHVKILDITRKNKNLIPTVEAHRCVLVFTEAGDMDIFYKMWNVGLGDCEVIYNEGSEPVGEIKRDDSVGEIPLLRQEGSAGNTGKFPGQEEHQTRPGKRQQGEHGAQHQHADNDRHDRQTAVDELRNALAHQLS